MIPFVSDPDFTLYVGDVRDVLSELPDESVHCVVTSPPYWGLRDYGTGTWDGGDPDCDHKMPGANKVFGNPAFNENRPSREQTDTAGYRDLCGKCGATRTDQQLGLEPSPDAYVARMVEVFREVGRVLRRDGTCWLNIGDSYAGGGGFSPDAPSNLAGAKQTTQKGAKQGGVPVTAGLKAKDLVGIPWRLAFALQADGWYLRSDIIWAKPNPMPESVTDRPTKAHEYLFLLTKSPRYFYDADAIREAYGDPLDAARYRVTGDVPGQSPHGASRGSGPDGRRKTTVIGQDGSEQHRNGERWPNPSGRNARSVWEIATQPYAEAHFATFPEELPRRCIAAGCPADGTVLDPFMGSGTTALVTRKLGRRSIGIELNQSYAELAARRLSQLSLLAEEAS